MSGSIKGNNAAAGECEYMTCYGLRQCQSGDTDS